MVSRGRILSHDTDIALNGGKSKTWQFFVTPQMSPSARLIGYYIDNNGNVVADSILLDVEDSLPTKVLTNCHALIREINLAVFLFWVSGFNNTDTMKIV